MENHKQLCMNCFAGYDESKGHHCPTCGWDNSKEQVPEGLQYNTLLGDRYIIGRVKLMNGEGMTYAAFDKVSKRLVEIREFFPLSISSRYQDDNTVIPYEGKEADFDAYLDAFTELSRNVSRMKEITVVHTVLDIFEENYTAYTVYEYVPSITLKRYIEKRGCMDWNQAHELFMPVLTAFGLMNSLGITHLGISPETIKITAEGKPFITGFSINEARRRGTDIVEELYPGCSAIEQYEPDTPCGEMSDVYAFAVTFLFTMTGTLPPEAPKRIGNERLMISKEVLHDMPPYAVTAVANALQVKQELRTASFERLKAELTAAPKVVMEISSTDAIRRLPSMERNSPQSRGLPPVVWLICTCIVTFIALVIVASVWLRDADMSFGDIGQVFGTESKAETTVVPNMLNENLDDWLQKAANGEYDITLQVTSQEFSDTVSEGQIISQYPTAGEPVPQDKIIVVTVSRGSAQRTLPEIKGMSFTELSDILEKNGFVVEREDGTSDDIAAGYVIGYKERSEGDILPYGSTVTVIVSADTDE